MEGGGQHQTTECPHFWLSQSLPTDSKGSQNKLDRRLGTGYSNGIKT